MTKVIQWLAGGSENQSIFCFLGSTSAKQVSGGAFRLYLESSDLPVLLVVTGTGPSRSLVRVLAGEPPDPKVRGNQGSKSVTELTASSIFIRISESLGAKF